MKLARAYYATIVMALLTVRPGIAADSDLPVLKVPDGFSIEMVAGPPLVERPIVAAFDDEGRLYVAESSGSNDPVEKQLEERPHRIVRLDDVDGDGVYDRRTVFADRMMFPEGTMYFDGSLYVSAPPSIWKLTDTNGDGVADERVEWFQGKTLTGCANDLHGPYLGPDGWVYWCKGAFAEQTHVVHGREWKSRAAHIFRCRPDGTGLEPVLTGGMDNPVDVVFMPDGERILSATFLAVSPRVDGLAHAIYGGVYGKEHGVLSGHPRTGELMPTLVPLSAAAPCGLERYESDAFGGEYRDNLFLCHFNMRKVSRHVLLPAGSTYATEDSDFVWSEHVDFHPTDILMDADGSLLVIDTGGWYKLCCPTSQLWKPDVLGGIYRVRRDGAASPADPRGLAIDWAQLTVEQLWTLLADSRLAVRQRASRTFVSHRDADEMRIFLQHMTKLGGMAAVSHAEAPPDGAAGPCDTQTASLARLWAVSQLENAHSRSLVRELLFHPDLRVRHAALNVVSLYRDADASPQVVQLLAEDTAPNRRAAAEALGRIGRPSDVPHLLAAVAEADDRILQHSITFALIELAQPATTRAGLANDSPRTVAVSLLALDQMPGGSIRPDEVIPLLGCESDDLRRAALWLAARHVEWGSHLSSWFRQQLAALADVPPATAETAAANPLEPMLTRFAANTAIQKLLSDTIVSSQASIAAREIAIRAVAHAGVSKPPASWRLALARIIRDSEQGLVSLAIDAARKLPAVDAPDDALNVALLSAAKSSRYPDDLRIAAMATVSHLSQGISEPHFNLLLRGLSSENSVTVRSAAADAISHARLNSDQLERLCVALKAAGPLELNRLLPPFRHVNDEQLALKLLSSLKDAAALAALRVNVVRETLADHGSAVQQGLAELESLVNVDAAVQRKRIEELLPNMSQGDVRRGHAVFHSSKASCSACHRLGYAGGSVGPDLSRIGEVRTERDLLESILYPSLSFVRSYEPVLIVTLDGRTVNGNVIEETADEYVVVTDADHQVRVRREDVEEMHPSTVSTMPSGLDQQLTTQQLADLVAFLKSARK
ncbi:MAG TPA: PVC-type heme-binding CxxCH protein [Lacipirellulaceae bacterium]